MHVSGLAVSVRILAMAVSGGSLLRGFFMVVVILLLGRLAVLFHRCFRPRSRLVLLAGWLCLFLFLLLSHRMSP
jgi:ribosomal protein S6E (S10)